MNKLKQLTKSRPFRISFLISFLVCFLAVTCGFERAVVDVLAVAASATVGLYIGMAFRRWRGDFHK